MGPGSRPPTAGRRALTGLRWPATMACRVAWNSDDAGQLAIVENCINSGKYAGIAIAPVNSTTLVSAVKLANNAGIPVVNIDERFNVDEMKSQGARCVGFASSDNQAIGYMGAEYLCTLIEKGSQVGVVEGILDQKSQ